jgi:hypothetical protein
MDGAVLKHYRYNSIAGMKAHLLAQTGRGNRATFTAAARPLEYKELLLLI